MFGHLRQFLAGKKTYLLMAAGILGAVIGWASGDLTTVQALGAILAALGISTVAARVTRSTNGAPPAPK